MEYRGFKLKDITDKRGREQSGTAPASSPLKAECSRMHHLLCLQESWLPPGLAGQVKSTWQLEETSENITCNIDVIAVVLWRDLEELLLFCFNSYGGVVKLSCRMFKDLKDKSKQQAQNIRENQFNTTWVGTELPTWNMFI